MRRIMIALLLGAVLSAGCAKKEEEKPENAPPPPPTAEELYSKLRAPLDPMFNSAATGAPFSNAQRSAAIQGLQPLRMQMASEVNGAPAVKRIEGDIQNLIKDAKQKENWRVVKGGIEAYKIFQPTEKRYADDERYADLMIAMPSVAIDGFFELDGEPVVFVEVTDANTGKKSSYKVREGEDFHETLQLTRLIGRRDAIEVLYKPVNKSFTVNAPSNKKKNG